MSAPYRCLSYGAGTNSTAMLIGLAERGETVDRIIFSDTGGELPATYALVDTMSAWCVARGLPGIETVRATRGGVVETLEEDSLRTKHMPSIAYGFKQCSDRFKRRPQDTALRLDPRVQAEWAAGRKVERLIGFDANEPHRAERGMKANSEDRTAAKRWTLRYPLIEWDWGRAECVEAIARAGIPQPGKSACYFCPMSKPREVWQLHDEHPELFARACAIEAAAEPFSGSIKGLGAYFSWRDLVRQGRLFHPWPERGEVPCDCYDGETP
jgi:hypothetical protein